MGIPGREVKSSQESPGGKGVRVGSSIERSSCAGENSRDASEWLGGRGRGFETLCAITLAGVVAFSDVCSWWRSGGGETIKGRGEHAGWASIEVRRWSIFGICSSASDGIVVSAAIGDTGLWELKEPVSASG